MEKQMNGKLVKKHFPILILEIKRSAVINNLKEVLINLVVISKKMR